MRTNNAYVLMLTGAKGGTGKSVVCSLLGLALAQRGLKVLAIELNTGSRSLDYPCGVHESVVYDLGDVFEARCDASKAIMQSPYNSNLHVLCTQRCGGIVKPQLLVDIIEQVKGSYSVILIDVESGFGVPFKSACIVSNGAFIVTTPDIVALNANAALGDILFSHPHITTKLFINKVPQNLNNCGIRDLDECIDTTCVQLIGVAPLSSKIEAAGIGNLPDDNSKEFSVFKSVAARICGINAPLIYK